MPACKGIIRPLDQSFKVFFIYKYNHIFLMKEHRQKSDPCEVISNKGRVCDL